jgi:hypothetical protein
MKYLKAIWELCSYLFWPQWGKNRKSEFGGANEEMVMKRKAIIIGNSRELNATPMDMLRFSKFLMSLQGGAWEKEEIVECKDKAANDILKVIDDIKAENNDYVIVYFTGHGGVQGDTILEVNPASELLKENSFFGLATRQLNIMDCCRCLVTTPLSIYGSSRGMSPMQRALRDEVRKEYEELVMNAAPQLVRMYSCREGESSWPSKDGSYYTNNLIGCAKDLLNTNSVVWVYQCHDATAVKTTADVQDDLHRDQHPDIIPTKCLAQAELPICFNPKVLKS